MRKLTVGSLFAGIGGIELGLEWTGGFETVWQVENDEYATKILAKHWPEVERWSDVRTFPPEPVNRWRCDLVAGGFPCQDISYAGKGAGLDGERSGLWWEFARVVRTLRPRYVLVENVGGLLARGLDAVLGTLASFGYDAEWHCVPAAAVGAPHIRDRVFILAYTLRSECKPRARGLGVWEGDTDATDAQCNQLRNESRGSGGSSGKDQTELGDDGPKESMADADGGNEYGRGSVLQVGRVGSKETLAETCERTRTQWSVEPDVGRVAHGVPFRVDRLRCLGNAVVPQVAQYIGEQILKFDRSRRE
jgi:DNA (cytosine-5)-methyltransferase 1